jgi:acyl carrier protein
MDFETAILRGREPGARASGASSLEEKSVSTLDEIKSVLGRALQLGDKTARLDAATGLFGNIPEFDSMAVVTVVAAIEERFGIVIDDDEISADIFETVGSLSRFVEGKLGG